MWPVDWFRLKSAEHRVSLKALELQEQALKEATWTDIPANARRELTRYDPQAVYFTEADGPVVLGEREHAEVQQRCQQFYNFNPWAFSVVQNLTKYVFGSGLKVLIQDERAQKQFDDWAKEVKWQNRMREMGRRIFRDGECFLQRVRGDMRRPPDFRFIGTHLVRDPRAGQQDHATYGIETDPRDVEKPLKYYVVDERDRTRLRDGRPLLASEVFHVKIKCDSESKRGLPVLLPVLWILPRLPQVIKNRILLHQIRTAVAVVKKVSGGPSNLDTAKAAAQVDDKTDTSRIEAWKPGTVIWSTKGMDIDFKHPNFQAGDAYNDIRLFLLVVCSGCDLAEFMVTADASNQNFASILISESPVVRAVQDWQNTFDVPLENEVRWVLSQLQGRPIESLESLDIDVQWPPIVHRDIEATTKALSLQYADQAVSLETYRAQLGYDNAEEEERIEREMEKMEKEHPEPEAPPVPPVAPGEDDQKEEVA